MLPTAVDLDRSTIPKVVRDEVNALRGARPGAFTWQLLRIWLVIGLCIYGAERIGTWWATVLAIVVVAIRQSMLALLAHDQVHGMGYRNRWGDVLVNLTCAYPLLVLSVEAYAQVHLAHHKHYFTERDPDHIRKSGADWEFPKPGWDWLKLIASDLTGINLVKFIRGKRTAASEFTRPGVHPAWVRPAFLVTLAMVLTLTGGWKLFLVYWVVPFLTVLQLLFRWGAACEHQYNRAGATVSETTPLIVTPRWQQVLLPNLNFAFHTYHHHFPNIAFVNLPRVHAIFQRHGLVDEAAVFRGYGAYVRYLYRGARTDGNASASAAHPPLFAARK